METFTKLFSSITRSSVWLEDDQTRLVWITLLALADRDGYVGASVKGLAHMARVPPEKAQEALDKFLAPDPDSRSKDHDGRRLEVTERGWLVLNHGKFRDMRSEDARREYFREQKRKSRLRQSKDKSLMSTHADTDSRERMSPVVTFEAPTNMLGEKLGGERSAQDERDVRSFDRITKGGMP
jgi:hypothetical protein